MKLRMPDIYRVYTDNCEYTSHSPVSEGDIRMAASWMGSALRVSIAADKTPLKYIMLRWNFADNEKRDEAVHIMGDHYERGYSDLRWAGIEPERIMPWYMLVSNGTDRCADTAGRFTEGFGVKVQTGSIVTWQYDAAGVTMWADIRNGGEGVLLGGRELCACEIVFGEYRNMSAFEAGRAFCREMCPVSKLPGHKVYGSNNWYYAYGNSSHEEILGDTKIVAEQCKGLENIPYMVIDDGWQKHSVDAPWVANERFPDMKKLADEMRAQGVRPGIWVRYLIDSYFEVTDASSDWRLSREPKSLDPSHPEVIEYVKKTTKQLREWGYDLIKHDYSTYDIFGRWGFAMKEQMGEDGWHFFDRSRTTAEIVVDFYRAVREAAGEDCVIIGCNTIGHLCAGMYELNRTGDDTSGREWNRTRDMGVNTLAFRMIQNNIFYMTDADCVGIMGPVPWEKNRLWLDVLARSGSPLFVSCKPGILSEGELAELKQAWAVNSVQANDARPLDWMENRYPELWLIDGETVRYNWYEEAGANTFNPNK
ncbi:MAG: hypothetical protein IJC54_02265 [Clostridia bacterium]|nr:hypothetical protein [Clostridia bacterium]